ALGWDVYQSDHEDANGQFEINFRYAGALTTADRYTYLKMMTSQVGKRHGVIATHMAKPFANRTGSGAHFHFHLADARTGENLFLDAKDPRGLGQSRLAYHFLGGCIRHARALTAVLAPTVNCYKRLILTGSASGFTWVPAFISYGGNNRTQMFRTPGPGRFECRTVSAACNPYLALAALLVAGLDGIRNEIDPGDPVHLNMYALTPADIQRMGIATVPQSLPEALACLERDEVILSALGEPLAQEFLAVKRDEWTKYHNVVTQWEVDRYLQLF
ncbi:MAG: type III glutamate--ammonia ligase, partial [Candidatus Tectomicrobia bacterium]|nr:type III glutamate--ammonia ligase [Candidatus Tectomicrobia bacterium]